MATQPLRDGSLTVSSINGVPTDIYSRISSTTTKNYSSLLLCVPGSPGVAEYYVPFVDHLYHLHKGTVDVCVFSHAGHSPGFGKKKNKLGRDWYNLQDQIVVIMYLLGVDIPRAYTYVCVCVMMITKCTCVPRVILLLSIKLKLISPCDSQIQPVAYHMVMTTLTAVSPVCPLSPFLFSDIGASQLVPGSPVSPFYGGRTMRMPRPSSVSPGPGIVPEISSPCLRKILASQF